MKFKEENFKERLEFIDKWSKFVLENEDKVWSKQQNVIINSCLKSAEISKEDYLKLKETHLNEN
jgi:hypothetical protein